MTFQKKIKYVLKNYLVFNLVMKTKFTMLIKAKSIPGYTIPTPSIKY